MDCRRFAADIFESRRVNPNMLKKYDTVFTVVATCRWHCGIKFIKELPKLMDKAGCFATGASPASDEVIKDCCAQFSRATKAS